MASSLDNKSSSFDEEKHDTSLEHQKSEELNHAIEDEKSIGVLKAEILANQWKHTFWYKIILLISAFLVGYAYGLDSQTRYVYTAYATASWSEHSLLTTVNAITALTAAASQPVYARLSDVFGRLELFIVAVLFYVVGTIIECQSPTINAYVAGAVLYQIGYSGVIMVLLFILSDMSTLRFRLLFSICPSLPFIINTWIAGNVTSAVGMNWKWGIGMWAFILPLACIPFVCCMIHMRWLAGKTEEWRQFKLKKTKYQEFGFLGLIKYLFWKLDVIGLILMVVSLGCLLVPLTLAGGIKDKWKQGNIIAPIVIGAVLIPIFVLWEVFAKDPIIPVHLMKDRGIWSGGVISFLFDFVFAVEASFLYTVLVVAVDESQKSATRITSISSFTSVICCFIFGLFVVFFRRMKGFVILGCSLWMLAFGLMYHYRSTLAAHSGIIGAMVVMGLGTGFFTYPITVSAQSCVSHEHMAVVTSALYTLYRVGYAVGSSVAGAIWTQTLFTKLSKYLEPSIATSVYQSPFVFAETYEWGSPEREGAMKAYGEVQRLLMIVCLCFVAPMIFCAFFLRDHELNRKQSLENIEEEEEQDRLTRFLANFGRTR
ncbi:ARN1 [Candida pseudojiufengensis]|uniref:ARN1 n=1 Tax=Candida pseudojiufengensis TaxID=497109 RepID=UPI002225090B|nr:ARN1 [Candida pseudojiufengensis]KAI5960098.1 ARN1 [Candida pseudojiufengensis]